MPDRQGIIAITGGLGSGKTTLLAALALDDYQAGRRLVSDVSLRGVPYTRLPDLLTPEYVRDHILVASAYHEAHGTEQEKKEVWQRAVKAKWHRTTLVLDEAWSKMDSHDYRKPEVRAMGFFILLSRKLGVDIKYVAQRWTLVYNRLRMVTDLVMDCRPGPGHLTWVQREVPISETDTVPLGEPFPFSRQEYYPYFDTYDLVLPAEVLADA